MERRPRVALLGLGAMGAGMAHRLRGAGFPLAVYNRTVQAAQALAAEGATVARSPREAAAQAEVVIGMVADDDASRSIWLGEEGALPAAPPGATLVESSTLTVAWVRELGALARERGLELLDAPVTGSKPHAAAGELNFLVGGTEPALAHVRPVLEAMAKSIVHVGPAGSGALLKLINNFVCGVQLAGLAEGLALIERSGLDREKALGVLTGGAPGSPLVKTLAARMTAREYAPNFRLRLLAKDLAYALGEGEAHSLPLHMPAAALELLRRAIDAGHGDQDMSAVVELLRPAAS